MIPVSIQLNNFLSYGTDCPILDFELFRVACLSGKNGHGKSALLEAMTWAIWGEARKRSGAQKPDDGLLRIGQRQLWVEFTFDSDGERYRVKRSYIKTATGKSTKSTLELVVRDSSSEGWHPLTTNKTKDTQALLEKIVGVTYETFTNASFLLQGRSDEFTRRKPSERKEVLANILDLSKFDALFQEASIELRKAKQKYEGFDAKIAELDLKLKDVNEWELEKNERESTIGTLSVQLAIKEKENAGRYAKLEALALKKEQQEAIELQIVEYKAEVDRLKESKIKLVYELAEATTVLAAESTIVKAYEQYVKLTDRRQYLDDQRLLWQGIKFQIDELINERKTLSFELTRSLDKERRELADAERQLGERQDEVKALTNIESLLADAKKAQVEVGVLTRRQEKQRTIQDQILDHERQLGEERARLSAECAQLRKQLSAGGELQKTLSEVESKLQKISFDESTKTSAEANLSVVTEKGQEVRSALNDAEKDKSVLADQIKQIQEQIAKMKATTEATCPQCSTPLTDNHRGSVITKYQSEIKGLEKKMTSVDAEIERLKSERAFLVSDYSKAKSTLDAAGRQEIEFVTLKGQQENLASQVSGLASQKKALSEIEEVLAGEKFLSTVRENLDRLQSEAATIKVDGAELLRLQNLADKQNLYERDNRKKIYSMEQCESLNNQIPLFKVKVESVRVDLEGRAFDTLDAKIESKQSQLLKVDFNEADLHQVNFALKEVKHAGERMQQLINARDNKPNLEKRLTQNAEGQEVHGSKIVTAEQNVQLIEVALQAAAELQEKFETELEEIRVAKDEIALLNNILGQFTEKLDQAALYKKEQQKVRKAGKETKENEIVFKHLRDAFGKNGIPSLIIEDRLPELEERANELLQMLTAGRTTVMLETLRDNKSGGTSETLDIHIVDEYGMPRAYETFSGGEAFRVNFALRIALSKMLAERSGAQIRLLVIDEGFGTQDTAGVQNLISAINSIQNEFDKIIIISHLDEIKEAFPVRIEVEKDPILGSTFKMIGV